MENQQETQILDKIDNVLRVSFQLIEIKLSKDLVWTIKFLIQKRLPKTYLMYQVKMVFNEDPYLERINAVQREIQRTQSDQSLFPDMQASTIEDLKKQIDDIKYEMEDLKEQAKVIEYLSELLHVNWKKKYTTEITLRLPAGVINDINNCRELLPKYAIELRSAEV